MGQIFPANLNRYDPYKSYRFLIYFGKSTTAVAAVSKISRGQALVRRDRVQGGRQRHHPQGPRADQVRADHGRPGNHPGP